LRHYAAPALLPASLLHEHRLARSTVPALRRHHFAAEASLLLQRNASAITKRWQQQHLAGNGTVTA
jgi:hypothetical protein